MGPIDVWGHAMRGLINALPTPDVSHIVAPSALYP
ncbi:MAG: hypothetical protein RIQ73_362, partial [Actinomycetota bacterium]